MDQIKIKLDDIGAMLHGLPRGTACWISKGVLSNPLSCKKRSAPGGGGAEISLRRHHQAM